MRKSIRHCINIPGNCPHTIVPKWKNNVTPPYRINEIRLQHIQNFTVKTAYVMAELCDKILLTTPICKETLNMTYE